MANIIASARRFALAALGISWAVPSPGACDNTALASSTLPAAYTLSCDPDAWRTDARIFRIALTQPEGAIGMAFATTDNSTSKPLTRLDSYLTVGLPGSSGTARLGDGVSSASLWDQPARLGGVRWGSSAEAAPDVGTPPALLALPLAGMRSLMQYHQPSLSPSGQADFSVEAGRLRENFDVRSNDYGPWMTSGTYRYGVGTATTVDGQVAQVAGQQNFFGVGVVEQIGPVGLVSARVAGSRESSSGGWLAGVGYDYSHAGLRFALQSRIQSSGFAQVGDAAAIETFRQRTVASAGVDLGDFGRLSLAGALQIYGDESRRDLLALTQAVPFSGGVLSAAACYSPGQYGTTELLLSFRYPRGAPAPAQNAQGSLNDALHRGIVDSFGQPRWPPGVRQPLIDRTPSAL